jgi:hypothetical protein
MVHGEWCVVHIRGAGFQPAGVRGVDPDSWLAFNPRDLKADS